jgi:hypothetical protein
MTAVLDASPTPRTTAATLLERAADLIRLAGTAALVAIDFDQAERLDEIATILDDEAHYRCNCDRGLTRVSRRTDAPTNATNGWWIAYDAPTRVARAKLGLEINILEDVAQYREGPA